MREIIVFGSILVVGVNQLYTCFGVSLFHTNTSFTHHGVCKCKQM